MMALFWQKCAFKFTGPSRGGWGRRSGEAQVVSDIKF